MATLNNKETAFRVASFNMRGFNQGCAMLNHLCKDISCDVIFIQEHWQTPANLSKIISFSDSHLGFGVSAMEDKVGTIFHGRPYGGTAILVSSRYAKTVKNVICSERFVIVLIGSFALVNLYFRCKSYNVSGHFMNTVNNMIDEITAHSSALAPEFILIGGDMNCDLRVHSSIASAVHALADDLKLINCYTVTTPSIDYTFHNISMGQTSLIDWFLISDSLQSSVVALNILDDEPNSSDHLPVVLDLQINPLILISTIILKIRELM